MRSRTTRRFARGIPVRRELGQLRAFIALVEQTYLRDPWQKTRSSVSVVTCPGVRHGLDDRAFDVRCVWRLRTKYAAIDVIHRKVIRQFILPAAHRIDDQLD